MATFLLTWNPKSWDWNELQSKSRKLMQSARPVQGRWSCGNTRKIQKGDRFFLLKQGNKEPTGLIGSGSFDGSPYADDHWEPDRAKVGDKALYAKVSFDCLLDPSTDRILLRRFLKSDKTFSEVYWDTQRSGIEIPESIAAELEEVWAEFARGSEFTLPDEVRGDYFEGALRQIRVNVYERDLIARERCLAHFGNQCVVCEFDFDDFYGTDLARGYVHVHHLVPLSEIRKEYKVDPISDLRPVCPNCHAMIHRKLPAYTIDEIRLRIDQNRKTKLRK